jgi:asparagine synthase (glutamine-hydrolysing)
MCGFVFTTNPGIAKIALQKQIHRGPDGFRIWKDDHVAIAHALLDINGEKQFQPYVTPAGNILAFNGEMFDSPIANDTEWLAKGLDKYGFTFVQNTDWQGAFVLYKPKERKVFAVRDHFGAKPLWWGQQNGAFTIATSLKSFVHKEIDTKKLNTYQVFGQCFGSESIYKGINKLGPGEILEIDFEKKGVYRRNLWDSYKIRSTEFDPEEFIERTKESVLKVAKTKQKLGMFLSGGLDSTVVASILAKEKVDVELWTCGYNLSQKATYWAHEGFDGEKQMAIITADWLGLPINKVVLDRDDRYSYGKMWLANTHYPWADCNRQAPRYLLAKAASRSGCKVILTGDSGDELFTGYTHHDRRDDDEQCKRLMKTSLKDPSFPKGVFGTDLQNNSFFVDLMTTSEQNILATDQTIGMFGMESRIPFLTQNYAKYVISINSKDKFKQLPEYADRCTTKYFMRETMKEFLPDHVRYRAKKTGWSSPWDNNHDNLQKKWRNLDIEFLRQVAY